MDKFIMVGCDLHDRNMLLKLAVDRQPADKRSWANDPAGRAAMIADLKRRAAAAGGGRIVFAYEASGLGWTLWDELHAAGVECYVLAPSKIERSAKHRSRKTDERDAQRILEILRGWLLAGNELPAVWVPDVQTRDDREITRVRLDVADKLGRCKTQVRCLLKRNNAPPPPARPWTGDYCTWLEQLRKSVLPRGASIGLSSLLRQIEALESEVGELNKAIVELSKTDRYVKQATALVREVAGVGVLTAMVFLTEMGDLRRFSNRQQVGSFLGLTPESYESGQAEDRKGHITRQGSPRIRKVLNQAIWSRLRTDRQAADKFARVAERNPTHRKKAVVALMRDLGISMWHKSLVALAA